MKRLIFPMLPALLAACSTPLPPPPPAPAPAPAPQAAAPEPAPPAVLRLTRPMAAESPMVAFERMRAARAGDSVYFDFDRFAIRSDQSAAVSEHAKLAIAFSNDQVTLHNLALGQRRADAVRQSMVLLGVPQDRIETISFGKEKSRALCHEESCWTQNRRAGFGGGWNGTMDETRQSAHNYPCYQHPRVPQAR